MKFIAEVGVNHLGSEENAISYCSMLAKTQVDAVSLQIREDSFYDGSSPWKHSLSKSCYLECTQIVRSSEKLLGIAISDLKVAKRYVDLAPDFWKVLSWGITDIALIHFLLDTGITVYVSTGTSDMTEIKSCANRFDQRVQFIHTQLSVELAEVNLSAISTIRHNTGCPVSFGLHCDNFDVINVAIPFEPKSIFFYVKERQDLEYPDGSYAILISNVDLIIEKANKIVSAIGDGLKNKFVPKTLSHNDKPQALR